MTINVHYYDMKCLCANLTYMNCNESTYTHTILIKPFMMMIIQGVEPMT